MTNAAQEQEIDNDPQSTDTDLSDPREFTDDSSPDSLPEPDDETALNAELEALLQTQSESSDLDDLDALLQDSLAIRDEALATKGLREKLKRGGMAAEERAEIEAKVREWEARREWDTLANVAVWERHECQCGSVRDHFSHIMHKQQHREHQVTRYVASDEVLLALPNLVAMQEMTTPMCPACAAGQGFDLTAEGRMAWKR